MTLRDGLVVYLVLCSELYDREGSPYADAAGNEFADNAIRFARLSLAAADLAMRGLNGWRPDVLHLNDWPTALAAGYLRWRGGKTRTVLTIHNLAHQGQFDASRLDDLAIPNSAFRLDGVEFYGRISFLKAGIVYADHVTTVCATYAEEIARPEFGCGLNGLLAERANEGRLTGIRNGVDASWDPRADKRNPYRFDAHRWKDAMPTMCAALSASAFPPGRCSPLSRAWSTRKASTWCSRRARRSSRAAARSSSSAAASRSTSAARRSSRARYPHAVGARIGFDGEEARAVFAGADFLLMPSRYEPCGLSQMYAQRFGALPIGHRTGGLAETIEAGRTGFLFDRLDIAALDDAIDDAFAVFKDPLELQAMRRAAMAKDFGWADSALAYGALYRKLGEAPRAEPRRRRRSRRPARRQNAPRRASSTRASLPPRRAPTPARCNDLPPRPRFDRTPPDARLSASPHPVSVSASAKRRRGEGGERGDGHAGEAAGGAARNDRAAGARRGALRRAARHRRCAARRRRSRLFAGVGRAAADLLAVGVLALALIVGAAIGQHAARGGFCRAAAAPDLRRRRLCRDRRCFAPYPRRARTSSRCCRR